MRCKDTLLSQFVQIFETFSFVYFQFFLQRLCFQWVCCYKKMRLHPQVKPQLYFVLSILFGGFQPAVEPTDKCAVEKHTVLGLENPVIFIGEDEQLGRNATQLGSIECTHTLRGKDAEVFLTMNAEDGSIPFAYKAVG